MIYLCIYNICIYIYLHVYVHIYMNIHVTSQLYRARRKCVASHFFCTIHLYDDAFQNFACFRNKRRHSGVPKQSRLYVYICTNVYLCLFISERSGSYIDMCAYFCFMRVYDMHAVNEKTTDGLMTVFIYLVTHTCHTQTHTQTHTTQPPLHTTTSYVHIHREPHRAQIHTRHRHRYRHKNRQTQAQAQAQTQTQTQTQTQIQTQTQT